MRGRMREAQRWERKVLRSESVGSCVLSLHEKGKAVFRHKQ